MDQTSQIASYYNQELQTDNRNGHTYQQGKEDIKMSKKG